ncbi:MAG: hypothetical protein ACOC45_03500 [Alkalispirochaetaceae bacterium]
MYVSAHHNKGIGINSYLVGPEGGGNAIFVDPAAFDADILTELERESLVPTAVLLTTPEEHNIRVIQTIQKVYEVEVIAGTQALTDIDCRCITELSTFEVAGLPVTAIPMLPHTRRSLVYHVGSVLFTGLIMHAGTVGDAPNSYAEALLAAGIIDHLFDYPEETPILPALGPPSNVRCERALNPWLREFLENNRL